MHFLIIFKFNFFIPLNGYIAADAGLIHFGWPVASSLGPVLLPPPPGLAFPLLSRLWVFRLKTLELVTGADRKLIQEVQFYGPRDDVEAMAMLDGLEGVSPFSIR